MKQKASLPVLNRAAEFVPASVDKDKRTASLVWSVGARVFVPGDWFDEPYFEELAMDPACIRMDRMNTGAVPLLNSHQSNDLSKIMGTILGGTIANGEGTSTAKFSRRPDVEPYFQDVEDGVIRNVSVGYRVYKYQDISAPDDPVKVLRAIDWEPLEVSLVPVGADAAAGVRSESRTVVPCEIVSRADHAQGEIMPDPIPAAAPAVVPAPQAAPAVAPVAHSSRSEAEIERSAVAGERARAVGITEAVRKAGLPVNFGEDLIVREVPLDKAREAIIDELHKKTSATPIIPTITGGVATNSESRMRNAEQAILHRHDAAKYALTGDSSQFRGFTMMEMARHFLEANGKITSGLSKMEIAKRAFEGVTDFASLLANVANKTLRDSYQSAPQTFKPITKLNMAADFKQMSRVQLSDAPTLEIVNASGEIKRGAMTDGKEVYSLATYAKIVPINRQAIINDDTSAFTRIPALMGRAAADLESDTVWNIFKTNPTMGDALALFHATHKNLAGSGTALAIATMASARAAMKAQLNLAGRPINALPKFLICDPTVEYLAEQVIGPIVPNAATSFNPFMGKLTIISEPRLSTGTTQPWYIAADPSQVDIIETSYLEGQEGVYLETRQGFDVDGIEIKARLDFAAKALDWRGLYKNPGV